MDSDAIADYQRLTNGEKTAFLSYLIFHICEVSRSAYPEARVGKKPSILVLEACNEMVLRASSQLHMRLGDPERADLGEDRLIDWLERFH